MSDDDSKPATTSKAVSKSATTSKAKEKPSAKAAKRNGKAKMDDFIDDDDEDLSDDEPIKPKGQSTC